jgi:protein SCO1/2
MIRRYGLWILAALALAALGGAEAWRYVGASTGTSSAAIGGPFRLVDQNGRSVDQNILNGKWSAVFFGYTYCPDVCPTTLQALAQTRELLGAKAGRFQVVFITVDPQRDTPDQLKDYLSNATFPKGVIGLTGAPAQIEAVARQYGVYYQKQGEGANYAVNHSSAIYLLNPKGRFVAPIGYGLTPAEMRDQIVQAMRTT